MNRVILTRPYLQSTCDNSKIYIEEPKFTIGRNPENSYVLDDYCISKTHCIFEKLNGVWFLTDNSYNGLILNRQIMPTKLPCDITDGDTIKLPNGAKYIFVNKTEENQNNDSSDLFPITRSVVPVVPLPKPYTVMPNVTHRYDLRPRTATNINQTNLRNSNTSNIAGRSASTSSGPSTARNIRKHFVRNVATNVNDFDLSHTNTFDVLGRVTSTRNISVAKKRKIDSLRNQATNVNELDLHDSTASNMPSTSGTRNSDESPPKKIKPENSEDEEEEELENVDRLQCIICTEFLIKATRVNCLHSFCLYCIQRWDRKNRTCPVCRTEITDLLPAADLDNLVTKFMKSSKMQIQEEREKVIKKREWQMEHPMVVYGDPVRHTFHYVNTSSEEEEEEDEEDELSNTSASSASQSDDGNSLLVPQYYEAVPPLPFDDFLCVLLPRIISELLG